MMLEERTIHNKNGKWKEFNKRAVLIAEGHYVNDLKHGVWREYYDTGSLLIEEHYHLGVPHGRYASFHPNGNLFSEGYYENGKREGYFHVYDENGRRVKSLLFIDNNQIEEMTVNNQVNELPQKTGS